MRNIENHFIRGKFVVSHGQQVHELISPVTRQTVGTVKLGSVEDADAAIAAAKETRAYFAKLTPAERGGLLLRLAKAIEARTSDHIEALAIEYGAGRLRAEATVARAVKCYTNTHSLIPDVRWTQSYGDVEVERAPIGVAALITPWNANLQTISQKVAPALAAGCPVVVKPSELSALQTQVFMECLNDADLPPGLVNVVNGLGEVVGERFSSHPDVGVVSFTGSTAIGKRVLRNSADTMKRVTLELGGKSATIILDDADIDQAVNFALEVAFRNSGQACIAGTRLLVPRSQAAEVRDAIVRTVPQFSLGDPAVPGVRIGPLVSEKQYQRVQGYIRSGLEEGAELLLGGEGHPEGLEHGYFARPTVFVNVTNDMAIARDEIFGPVIGVIEYDDVDEAVRIANDSRYGLFAYVASSNPERARIVASQLEAGGVFVNKEFDFWDYPNAPVGGFKESGIGCEFGVEGIEEFTDTRSVWASTSR